MDLRLSDEGKLLLKNGQLFLTDSRGSNVSQRLLIKLKTHRGTWFLNITYGLDWFGKVFTDGVAKLTVDSLLQTEILKDKYVEKITAFFSEIDNITGIYSCTFSVKVKGVVGSVEVRLLTLHDGTLVVDSTGNAISV